ncbi:MAG: transcriptional regulator GutM [Propionibacteriaceae bacterium]|nr:transcriptional regulator [Micropruina sp.]HBX80796.1 transcriptional regulator [Propionibacteriaceae bacterium]
MDWTFPALLVGALVLNSVMSLWQQRRYINQINAMARAWKGPNRRLVSGRGKGRLRGAVAVLIVDTEAGEVIEARRMSGATVFAKLGPAPELLGPLATVVDRATDPRLAKAVTAALTHLAPGARTATAPDGSKIKIRPATNNL